MNIIKFSCQIVCKKTFSKPLFDRFLCFFCCVFSMTDNRTSIILGFAGAGGEAHGADEEVRGVPRDEVAGVGRAEAAPARAEEL